jgi:hypothetical protein
MRIGYNSLFHQADVCSLTLIGVHLEIEFGEEELTQVEEADVDISTVSESVSGGKCRN